MTIGHAGTSRLAITGASGFLGWHFRVLLHSLGRVSKTIDRCDFQDSERLAHALAGCETVVHLAGMNRGDEDEIARTNVDLARKLAAACDAGGVRPHVVFANSTHRERDSGYGRSKHEAADLLRRWAERSGARVTDVIFPHLFGEFGKPFYNSAIATFCHQLARAETPAVINDSQLELVHAQQAAETLLSIVNEPGSPEIRVSGEHMLVSEALSRLTAMAREYRDKLIPDVRKRVDLDLFNTYRSYLAPEAWPVRPALHADDRGRLFEGVRTLSIGQTFVSTTHAGVTRGNHYHRRKLERFLVVQGDAVIRIRRLLHSPVHEFRVSGAEPTYIDMPTLHAHNITNCGSGELVTLFWAHEIFDPSRSDTYPERVEP